MARVFLGLGANVGDRERNLRMALRMLPTLGDVVAVSSLYCSDAVVLEGQPPGPDYLNAVCELETQLEPLALLQALQQIEHDIGRRRAERWAPRPIDLDVLIYDDLVIETPELTVPHARLAERNFVLVPLAELAPHLAHPALGVTVSALAEDIDLGGIEHLEDPGWVHATAVAGDE
jgi:2-amino-4-hydroxy-6-hydroxymethyldihydropteridine diphosphokinase